MIRVILIIFALIVYNEAVLYEGDPCTIKNKPGICTNQDNCPQLREAYRQGAIRNEEIPHCGYTIYKEIICCPTEKFAFIKPTFESKAAERPAIHACNDIKNDKANHELVPHVINGDRVEKDEFSFMASLGNRKIIDGDEHLTFTCGGTLIADKYVLTAAHCVADPEIPVNVALLGSISLNDAHTDILYDVKEKYMHPEYHLYSVYNDIAIVELKKAVNYTNSIYPLCLYSESNELTENSNVYVTGWGRTEKKPQSDYLLKAKVNIVPLAVCSAQIAHVMSSRRLANGIQNTQICAKGENNGDCQGDSGGPLIYEKTKNEMYLAGIINGGYGCGGATPNFYTKVSKYLDFIESIVWPSLK